MKRLLAMLILTGVMALGCEDEVTLDANDRELVFTILQTGVDHPTDPYVRAETLRIIELLHDSDLDRFAKSKLSDSSPMVRVAAMRALLRTGKDDIRATVLERFAQGDALERQAIMDTVLEHGPEPLARELIARALRSPDALVRQSAFRQGMIARVDEALAQKNEKYLERTLYPEMAQYVNYDDPVLGAMALRKFIEVGQGFRAETILKAFARKDIKLEERVKAAQVLVGAHVPEAVPEFRQLLAKYDAVFTDDTLGVPDRVVPPPLLRYAILGLAASGDESVVKRAQAYLTKADAADTIEVLDALATNPSQDAGISIKIAMSDVRDAVRERAIALYQQRADVDPVALSSAMLGAPFSTQRSVAKALIANHAEAWTKRLDVGIRRPSERETTLRLLRDVILTKDEAQKVLVPLHPALKEVSGDGPQTALAAYLLAISTEGYNEQAFAELDKKFDDGTRYAFIEFMVRENPQPYRKVFRTYFEADLFAIRLMSAAGLWRLAVPANAAAPAPTAQTNQTQP